jgi:glycosyltransferase involved in cell wall biosynthesis
MKLLVLIESANHVSYRYRVQAFQPALEAAGWSVLVRQVPRSVKGLGETLRLASQSSTVLLQRRLLSTWKLKLLHRSARRLVYDFDDAVFLRDSNSPKAAESWQRRRRFDGIVSISDTVIAGNQHLAERALRLAPRGAVHVIPTCVDPGAYRQAVRTSNRGSFRMAWIGSSSTLPSLVSIRAALSEIERCVPGFRLHVICDRVPDLPGVTTILRPWSEQSQADDLAACDAGISWLPDHPWSLGKCGLKVLQYMAAGLPVVANAAGIHRRLVTSGVNGILVNGAEGLRGAVSRLAESPAWRAQLGQNGRDRVGAEYSASCWASEFVNVLDRTRRRLRRVA